MWIPVHAERVEKNRVYDKTKPPEQEVKIQNEFKFTLKFTKNLKFLVLLGTKNWLSRNKSQHQKMATWNISRRQKMAIQFLPRNK